LRLQGLLWGCLGISAALWVGFDLWIGLSPDDSENLETTRVLAAARQLTEGFGGLYGPYSGSNPCVLIQAPLYYRLTALGAWPLTVAGMEPVRACFVAGRLLSVLSFLGLLVATYCLTVVDMVSRRAGWWGLLLVAGCPLVGSFPVTMRPDMFGIVLQTAGVWLVLRAVLAPENGRSRSLSVAYLLFAMAWCSKQHFVIGPLICGGLLLRSWWRREIRAMPILTAHGVAFFGVLGYLLFEEVLTSGAMSRSVFQVPRDLQRVTAGSWSYVVVVFTETLKRGIGPIGLSVALAFVPGWGWRTSRLDRWLGIAMLLELLLMVRLCLNSSGAWFNYALQALVYGAVLIGRGLDRATAMDQPLSRLLPVGVAALALVVVDGRLVSKGIIIRREALALRERLLVDPLVASLPRSARYFPGTYQHYNWRIGHASLTHDEWLYQAFEAIREAEPRQVWLRNMLKDGPIRLVVTEPGGMNPDTARVAGVSEPLTTLGYQPSGRVGRFALWVRR
jgi:hypothetical protein